MLLSFTVTGIPSEPIISLVCTVVLCGLPWYFHSYWYSTWAYYWLGLYSDTLWSAFVLWCKPHLPLFSPLHSFYRSCSLQASHCWCPTLLFCFLGHWYPSSLSSPLLTLSSPPRCPLSLLLLKPYSSKSNLPFSESFLSFSCHFFPFSYWLLIPLTLSTWLFLESNRCVQYPLPSPVVCTQQADGIL